MVWFYPVLPVLHIHPNITSPTARLPARRSHARYLLYLYCLGMEQKGSRHWGAGLALRLVEEGLLEEDLSCKSFD